MSHAPVPSAVPPPEAPPQDAPTGRLVAVVVGIIFALVLLTMAGLCILGYVFASKVSVTSIKDEQGRERTVRVETPLGRLRVEARPDVDLKGIGIPVYPGAAPIAGHDAGARVDLDLDFADKYLRVVAAELETADAFERVVEFYHDEAADFVFSRKSDGKVEFTWQRGRLKRVVGIRESGGKTRIHLASVGEPEAN